MLYHVSFEQVKDGIFYPRIPGQRLEGEDNTTKRICFSKSINGCLSAIPDGYTLTHGAKCLSEKHMANPILYVYMLNEKSVDSKNIIAPHQLAEKGLVPDAVFTGEHWVINTTVTCKEKRIYLNNVSWEPIYSTIGQETKRLMKVTQLEAEKPINRESDRVYYYVVFSQETVVKLKVLTKKHKCPFQLLETEAERSIVQVTIPKNRNAQSIWAEINKILIYSLNHPTTHVKKSSRIFSLSDFYKVLGENNTAQNF